MADINDLKKPVLNIENPNLKKQKVGLSDMMDDDETDAERARRKQALDGVDSSNAEVLEDGTKIITPDMIPVTKDPNAPDTTSMEEKEMNKLHDVITQKQQEAVEELNYIMAQAEVNEKIAQDKNIKFDSEGNAIGEDGKDAAELTEDEDLEAALDMEIATVGGIPIGVPGAPLSDPNHVYEEVPDDEFDALMKEDDELNGVFEDENLKKNKEAQESAQNDTDEADEDLAEALEESDLYNDDPNEDDIEEDETPSRGQVVEASKPVAKITPIESARSSDDSLDQELKDAGIYSDDDEPDLSEEEEEAERQEFVNDIRKTFNFAPERINLDDFTDAPPISASSVLSSLTSGEAEAATDWALCESKMPITLKKFTGIDLKNMADAASGRRSDTNALYERLRIIYDHDMNPNKPDTLEGWAKGISAMDINDLYFAVYDATFHNANHIPCVCDDEKCGHTFISEHIPTIDMVKFPDEEFKQEFLALRGSTPNKRYTPKVKLIPINDSIAVGIKGADLYDIGFIIRLVGVDFYRKYSTTIEIFPNIEDFYHIDLEKKTKQRISTAPRNSTKGDTVKEIKNRIIIFNRIISKLSSDEYNLLVGYTAQASMTETKRVSYEIPEIKCTKCGKPIAARPLEGQYTVENLLFERRPLPLITIT